MRGLKRKRRKFSRNLDRQSGGHRKDSVFDYAAYWMEQGVATNNVQQICATIALTLKSPPKKVVKRMLKAEVAKVDKLVNQNNQIQKGLESTDRKLLSLKDDTAS